MFVASAPRTWSGCFLWSCPYLILARDSLARSREYEATRDRTMEKGRGNGGGNSREIWGWDFLTGNEAEATRRSCQDPHYEIQLQLGSIWGAQRIEGWGREIESFKSSYIGLTVSVIVPSISAINSRRISFWILKLSIIIILLLFLPSLSLLIGWLTGQNRSVSKKKQNF